MPPIAPAEALRVITPKLAAYTDDIVYAEVWEDTALSKRDRSLITCAVLTALSRREVLTPHLARGLANGLTQSELSAMITHVAFYAGWPCAVTAAQCAHEVFEAPPAPR